MAAVSRIEVCLRHAAARIAPRGKWDEIEIRDVVE
jgi:hypothetical protein